MHNVYLTLTLAIYSGAPCIVPYLPGVALTASSSRFATKICLHRSSCPEAMDPAKPEREASLPHSLHNVTGMQSEWAILTRAKNSMSSESAVGQDRPSARGCKAWGGRRSSPTQPGSSAIAIETSYAQTCMRYKYRHDACRQHGSEGARRFNCDHANSLCGSRASDVVALVTLSWW